MYLLFADFNKDDIQMATTNVEINHRKDVKETTDILQKCLKCLRASNTQTFRNLCF